MGPDPGQAAQGAHPEWKGYCSDFELGVLLSALTSPLEKWLCKGGVIIHSTGEETEAQRWEGHCCKGFQPIFACFQARPSQDPRVSETQTQGKHLFSPPLLFHHLLIERLLTLMAWSK